MYKKCLKFPIIIIFIFSHSNISTGQRPLKNIIESILLTDRHFRSPSFVESIKMVQKRKNVNDSQVRDVLHEFITDVPKFHSDGLRREFIKRCIRLLPYYGNNNSKKLLFKYIKAKNNNVRHAAIQIYIHLSDYSITGPVKEVLSNKSKYDDSDRYYIYEKMIKGYKEARNMRGGIKRREKILNFIQNQVVLEKYRSSFVMMDKFLVKEAKDYTKSPQREKLLLMHSKKRKKKKLINDIYIEKQLGIEK